MVGTGSEDRLSRRSLMGPNPMPSGRIEGEKWQSLSVVDHILTVG